MKPLQWTGTLVGVAARHRHGMGRNVYYALWLRTVSATGVAPLVQRHQCLVEAAFAFNSADLDAVPYSPASRAVGWNPRQVKATTQRILLDTYIFSFDIS